MSKTTQYRRVTSDIICELTSICGAGYVIHDQPEKLESYSHDEIPGKAYRSMPEVVVRPRTTAEVAAIMKLANRERIPVTPRGAGSGLSGGAVPVSGGIVIATDRMNSIIELDKPNLALVVEPGVITNEINEFLREHKLFYAGYPMSGETCFIGGNVAENAGGGNAVKYGVTARYVLGLEVVTPQGDIVEMGGKLLKDVTGYNLVQLMLGSEGTLGIFTKITLRLLPLPQARADLLCLFPDINTAIDVVPRIMTETGITPTSIEFMDSDSVARACNYLNESLPVESCGAMLLLTFDGMEQQQVEEAYIAAGKFCEANGATEIYVADNPSTSERVWRIRRGIPEAYNVYSSRQSGEDLVVPPAVIPRTVAELKRIASAYKVMIPCYGHAGDGNIHARIICPPDWTDTRWTDTLKTILIEIYTYLREVGGRLSGEHGIGHKRRKYMKYVVSDEYIELLRAIKRAFDPLGILNPGKIFEEKDEASGL